MLIDQLPQPAVITFISTAQAINQNNNTHIYIAIMGLSSSFLFFL